MKAHPLDHNILWPSRCSLEGWNNLSYDYQEDYNPRTEKAGIRCHNWLTAFFLRIIGKIYTFKTESGGKVYLNKNSFIKWRKWRKKTASMQGNDLSKCITPQSTVSSSIRSNSLVSSPVSSPTRKEAIDKTTITSPNHDINTLPPPLSPSKKDDSAVATTSTVEQKTKTRTLTPLEQVLKKITKKSHKELGEIWAKFFNHFDSKVVKGWKKEDENTYVFTLSRQLKVWINSENGPKGGSVFILGDDNNEVKIKLKPNKMKFESGFTLYCNTGLINQTVTVYKMKKDDDQVEFKAGLSSFLSKTKGKPSSEYLKEWESGTPLSEKEDHEAFLKFKQKKAD